MGQQLQVTLPTPDQPGVSRQSVGASKLLNLYICHLNCVTEILATQILLVLVTAALTMQS